MPKKQKLVGERVYAILYTRFKREVRRQTYVHLDSACGKAFANMDQNRYEATVAQIVHLETGEVYLTIYLGTDGNILSFYAKGAREKRLANRALLKKRPEDMDR